MLHGMRFLLYYHLDASHSGHESGRMPAVIAGKHAAQNRQIVLGTPSLFSLARFTCP